ncbi:MAG TPA: hypothetical protein VLB84_18955, partial [Bacteroidia bacterium]|nr:hypothetical protein [Bacteroidia bacterium]
KFNINNYGHFHLKGVTAVIEEAVSGSPTIDLHENGKITLENSYINVKDNGSLKIGENSKIKKVENAHIIVQSIGNPAKMIAKNEVSPDITPSICEVPVKLSGSQAQLIIEDTAYLTIDAPAIWPEGSVLYLENNASLHLGNSTLNLEYEVGLSIKTGSNWGKMTINGSKVIGFCPTYHIMANDIIFKNGSKFKITDESLHQSLADEIIHATCQAVNLILEDTEVHFMVNVENVTCSNIKGGGNYVLGSNVDFHLIGIKPPSTMGQAFGLTLMEALNSLTGECDNWPYSGTLAMNEVTCYKPKNNGNKQIVFTIDIWEAGMDPDPPEDA